MTVDDAEVIGVGCTSVRMMLCIMQVPEAVLDESSPAYNRDRVWIDGGHPGPAQAYAAQARQDLFTFFIHRASELAPAGVLFLMCMCRADHARPEFQTSSEFSKANVCAGLFEEAWEQLVNQVRHRTMPPLISHILTLSAQHNVG